MGATRMFLSQRRFRLTDLVLLALIITGGVLYSTTRDFIVIKKQRKGNPLQFTDSDGNPQEITNYDEYKRLIGDLHIYCARQEVSRSFALAKNVAILGWANDDALSFAELGFFRCLESYLRIHQNNFNLMLRGLIQTTLNENPDLKEHLVNRFGLTFIDVIKRISHRKSCASHIYLNEMEEKHQDCNQFTFSYISIAMTTEIINYLEQRRRRDKHD